MMKMGDVELKYNESKNRIAFYKKFVDKKTNTLRIIKGKHFKEDIVYLGKLEDLTKNQSFHVIRKFSVMGIGLMLSPRGHSEIAFLNEKFDKMIIYDLTMPYELPKYIKDNVLYFKPEGDLIGISISGRLPPFLCVPKIGCN